MYALRPYLVNGYVPFGMQFAMKGASQPIDGLPWTMATKWDRLFVSVIKKIQTAGIFYFVGSTRSGACRPNLWERMEHAHVESHIPV